MEYFVIDGSQKETWNAYLHGLPQADVYFTPEYCEIYERNGEGTAQMFVYAEGDDYVCYPYLLRSLSRLPVVLAAGFPFEMFDIVTPYGYGGPLSNVAEPERRQAVFRRFSEVFRQYCRDKRIVTEFVRFHPLLRNFEDYEAAAPHFIRNTVYIDLRQSEDDILAAYTPNNRNHIRRALREELKVVHRNIEQLDDLLKLYHQTMDKKQASSYYYFDETFFRNTTDLLQAHTELIEVMKDNEVIASSLFLRYGTYAHYHLMGSDREKLSLAPVNLLIHRASLWAKEQGCQYMHLGGGYMGNDSLFRFKSGFNKREHSDFYIGKRIHCHELYDRILKRVYQGGMAEGVDDYFPVYRHPKLYA